jgi:hypothetical protein
MNSKVFGYIVSILGLLGLFFSSAAGASLAPFLGDFPSTYLVLISVALVVVGVVIVMASSKGGKQEKEVPIYKGKNIVGYRRH